MSHETTADAFQKGVRLFNARAFFDAHETWEEIWLLTSEPEKTFLQGIIQVAAGFHHYCRGNRAGAQSLLGYGLVKLARSPEIHRGLNIGALRTATRRWVLALYAEEDPGAAALPQIQVAELR